MKLRCVQCSHEVEKLYIQYSPGNIRLVKCANCKSVADEYIECELMILIIDLILHKPKAYRHLLFNLVQQKTPDLDGLLFKSSLVFLLLDAYRSWILNRDSQDWSVLSLRVNTLGLALLENVVSICALLVLSRALLDFVEGFTGHKDVLLAMIASSYLKVYILAMLVWEFPSSVVYITDLIVMSSNLVALRVITESSFRRCAGICLGAHAFKLLLNWVLQEYCC